MSKCKIFTSLAFLGVAVLSGCGGSLGDVPTGAGKGALASAAKIAFEYKLDSDGVVNPKLKHIAALTPLAHSSLKNYFDHNQVLVKQVDLNEISTNPPEVLYINTDLYDTGNPKLKEFLLGFSGILILDSPLGFSDASSLESITHTAPPDLSTLTKNKETDEKVSQPLKNPKAMALLMNLGHSSVANSRFYIASRKGMYVFNEELALNKNFYKELDVSLNRMLDTAEKEGLKLAAGAAGERFWQSKEHFVNAGMAHGWWVRYSFQSEALHNQSGGYQKKFNVRVKTDGQVDGRRGGFRRNNIDHDTNSGDITQPWHTQQWDNWGYDDSEQAKYLDLWARVPFGFETVILTSIPPGNGATQVSESLPQSIQDDRFKIGKERSLKAVIGASLAIPGIPFGINGGMPIYTGGYTDIWSPKINNDYTKKTHKGGSVSIRHGWSIGLNNHWSVGGLMTKGFPDNGPGDCDANGSQHGGCLNHRINALSKDGYGLSAGVSITIDRVKSRVLTTQVKQHLRLVTCGARRYNRNDEWYRDMGCRDWEDSIHKMYFVSNLGSKSLVKGAITDSDLTASDLIKQVSNL